MQIDLVQSPSFGLDNTNRGKTIDLCINTSRSKLFEIIVQTKAVSMSRF